MPRITSVSVYYCQAIREFADYAALNGPIQQSCKLIRLENSYSFVRFSFLTLCIFYRNRGQFVVKLLCVLVFAVLCFGLQYRYWTDYVFFGLIECIECELLRQMFISVNNVSVSNAPELCINT